MEEHQPTPNKKGLGPLAIIGIGCGSIIALAVLGLVIAGIMFGGKFKKFAEDAQKNPTRTTATMMVTASGGKMQLVAEDDANKRYTVKETKSGELTTIYWNEAKNAPEVVTGDFSAIPPTPSAAAQEPAGVPAPAVEK